MFNFYVPLKAFSGGIEMEHRPKWVNKKHFQYFDEKSASPKLKLLYKKCAL